MLTEIRQLQHELYGDWQCEINGKLYCKFCRVYIADEQARENKEFHAHDCERLTYLGQFYAVESYPSSVTGVRWVERKAFSRADVHGWRLKDKEVHRLQQAVEVGDG